MRTRPHSSVDGAGLDHTWFETRRADRRRAGAGCRAERGALGRTEAEDRPAASARLPRRPRVAEGERALEVGEVAEGDEQRVELAGTDPGVAVGRDRDGRVSAGQLDASRPRRLHRPQDAVPPSGCSRASRSWPRRPAGPRPRCARARRARRSGGRGRCRSSCSVCRWGWRSASSSAAASRGTLPLAGRLLRGRRAGAGAGRPGAVHHRPA